MHARDFLKLVLDPRRLAVIGAVAAAPRTAAEAAAAAGVTERDALRTLAPLVQGGIVAREGDAYRLLSDALRELAADLPQPAPPAPHVLMGMTEAEQQVLARFFSGERLVEIPATRSKRQVVLERLALDVEPGVRYDEREINDLLRRYHDDYTSLRRYLVDEGFLDRDGRAYWRSGGRVATLPGTSTGQEAD
ncbi:DUF2087 domain-containing protein [Egibacter rhizosphaerae]|uniref:DUF2087 domain-containing protein n=1 Tax=Egibacter rhizosphaerae TaxID=1670831 RepID=UPI0013F1727D|nr:DUF2087 domain-containing protein [Egibacter rhizosphaerae]